ncbi:MAG: HD domain-containing protein [Solirubrobacterales bacterium]
MIQSITLETLKTDLLLRTLIETGNQHLGMLGYTDHGIGHVTLVAERASAILQALGAPPREVELAAIAGYMHDIGNVINREGHSLSGALMAARVLLRLGMDPDEVAQIAAAIGNHDEGTGHPVNRMAAALILADKSHVHRTRVRNTDEATFDIHDRVNYAVNHAELKVDGTRRVITMESSVDPEICSVMDYFEIFLTRMVMSRRAAARLDCTFELVINGAKLL